MRRPRSFERRLLGALIMFSLIPTLLLVGIGTVILRETVSLQTTPAGWERLGDSGTELLDLTEGAEDEELRAAAELHREELTASIQQAQRWGYLNRRLLVVLPWLALGFVVALALLAVRSARRIARDLSSPISELVGWSEAIGRGDRLPGPAVDESVEADEFGVLRASFRRMAAELELSRARALESERMRASVGIARAVAHELKNALTPVRLAVRTIEKIGTSAPDGREAIAVIDAESRRLETLARTFAQLGSPPEGPSSEVDLVEMMMYLTRTNVPESVATAIRVDGGPFYVNGYHDALSRAFTNLIHNAVEAVGEDGGTIDIEIDDNDSGDVEVRIVDSGPGLAPGVEEHIWEPDFSTKSKGTGLGLALVRQTVQAHGGQVWASNSTRGGAELRVVLPRRSEA